jgi:ligand-binding sensor domain-containing protein
LRQLKAVSQYVRYFWGADKGFPVGTVSAFAQTADGYLWMGTDKGLIRFDGLAFQRFEQASPFSFQIGPVRKLMTGIYGNLWVLLQSTKLVRYKDGKFEPIRGEAENGITAIGQDTRGKVLFSSLAIGTLIYEPGRFATLLPAPAFADSPSIRAPGNPNELSTRLNWSSGHEPHVLAAPDDAVISMAGTTDGRIWLGTHDKGLFYLSAGRFPRRVA